MTQPMTFSRLRRIMTPPVAGPGQPPREVPARCELCAAPIALSGHRHLLDLTARELRCACPVCALLFQQAAAGDRHYRLVPDRRWYLPDFALDEATWAALRIPVDMAFFFHVSTAQQVAAFYPSPAGAVESMLDLAAWAQLREANPVLGQLAPDVEALLVNRARGAHDHWLVPVEDCYTLVALIRTGWRGLAGGAEVWNDVARFFADLGTRATSVDARQGPVDDRVPAETTSTG
jgi:hypothetical protein